MSGSQLGCVTTGTIVATWNPNLALWWMALDELKTWPFPTGGHVGSGSLNPATPATSDKASPNSTAPSQPGLDRVTGSYGEHDLAGRPISLSNVRCLQIGETDVGA
jgi:hypothetical protein